MILHAFADMECTKEASFLIGDRTTGIEAAEASGIPGFPFSGGRLLDFVRGCLAERWAAKA